MPCYRNNAYSDEYGNVQMTHVNPLSVYATSAPYAVDGVNFSVMNIVLFLIALFVLVQIVMMLTGRRR